MLQRRAEEGEQKCDDEEEHDDVIKTDSARNRGTTLLLYEVSLYY